MTTNEQIVIRFFQAVDALYALEEIKVRSEFEERYGINRRNLYQLRKEPWRKIFCVAWLSHLVTDYSVSADWLLTGRGQMFA